MRITLPSFETTYTNKVGIPMPENKGINQAIDKSDSFQSNVSRINPNTPVEEPKNRGAEISAYVKENMKPQGTQEEPTTNLDNSLLPLTSVEIYA